MKQAFHVKPSSSFYLPLLILPKSKRRAMMTLYGFCRAVDDIADSRRTDDEKHHLLDQWLAMVFASVCPAWADAKTYRQLQRSIDDYQLDRGHFERIVEAMRMDVNGQMMMPSQNELLHYCDGVAGCVGQLAIRIFGAHHPSSSDYAIYLGRALQLTNILRDIEEDAKMGRIYLPYEAFDQAGLARPDLATIKQSPTLLKPVCELLSQQVQMWFAKANAVIDPHDKSALKPALLMSEIYSSLLKRMIKDGWRYRTPYRVTHLDKVKVLWRYLRGVI